jgi:hypothetical protein
MVNGKHKRRRMLLMIMILVIVSGVPCHSNVSLYQFDSKTLRWKQHSTQHIHQHTQQTCLYLYSIFSIFFTNDHTKHNAPPLVRSVKLNCFGPCQFLCTGTVGTPFLCPPNHRLKRNHQQKPTKTQYPLHFARYAELKLKCG